MACAQRSLFARLYVVGYVDIYYISSLERGGQERAGHGVIYVNEEGLSRSAPSMCNHEL